MNHKLSVSLALIAGLLGGLLTRYIAPPAAFAQTQASVTKEIRAQSFVLVDPSDRAVGTFTVEPAGPGAGGPFFQGPQSSNNRAAPATPPLPLPSAMRIVLRDSAGHEIWSAGGGAFRALSER
jgi:hypothetical protein